jgi:hypothetical protein
MVASAAPGKAPPAAGAGAQQPLFPGFFDKMLSMFGIGGGQQHPSPRFAPLQRKASPQGVELAEIPVPPERPPEFGRQLNREAASNAPAASGVGPGRERPAAAALAGGPEPQPAETAQPERAPREYDPTAGQRALKLRLPTVISGAQPILPPRFSAYAEWSGERGGATRQLAPQNRARLGG